MKKFLERGFIVVAGLMIVLLAGCSSLESKAVGIASNGTVIKAETTGSATSGTALPNVLFGVVQNSVATAPALKDGDKTQVVLAYTESQNWFAALFGFTAITRTFTYIGLPSESAEQTKIRFEAAAELLKVDKSAQ